MQALNIFPKFKDKIPNTIYRLCPYFLWAIKSKDRQADRPLVLFKKKNYYTGLDFPNSLKGGNV